MRQETDSNTVIDLNKATVTIADRDLVIIRIKKDQLVDREDIYTIFHAHQEILGNTKRYVIFVTNNSSSITAEGRKASAEKKINENAIAKAIIVKNLANKLVTNFFIRVDKPSSNFKTFDSEIMAMEWINELRKTNQ
jgi:hypothetical protein